MAFIITAIIIIIDQATKYGAIKYLKNQRPLVIISDFFQLNYVENRGAAFGILQGRRVIFLVITIAVVLVIAFYLIRYYSQMNFLTKISLADKYNCGKIGGAIGNLIDRIRLGYVVDFISIKLIDKYDFPVFNIADICVVVSTILIVYLVLFDKLEFGGQNEFN